MRLTPDFRSLSSPTRPFTAAVLAPLLSIREVAPHLGRGHYERYEIMGVHTYVLRLWHTREDR